MPAYKMQTFLEYVHIYNHKCYITSEEEKQFKRQLQDLRRKKQKKEQLLGMLVEGQPGDTTQQLIDELVAKCKKKLKEIDQINSGVPMAEINAEKWNDLGEQVMLKMIEEEGFELDDITLDMVEQCMPKETKKILGDDLVFADIECIIDSTNIYSNSTLLYTRK